MANKELFSGITSLDPGEALSADGYAFQSINPRIIDHFLEIGARTHKHDGHAALANPTVGPDVTGDTANGVIPADVTISVAFTMVDAYGGETLPAPITSVTTNAPMEAPTDQPDFEIQAGGTLRPSTYYYALSLTDGGGGETEVGPTITVVVDPGVGNAKVAFVGLSDIVEATLGATGWKLYKATEVGAYHQLATGDATLDEFTDDGTACADCTATPTAQANTNATNSVLFTIPSNSETTADTVTGFRVYVGVDGDFSSPSYWGTLTSAALGVAQRIANLTLDTGAPPDISTSIQGADKIDPDTDLLDWNWKRPVATYSSLPAGEQGDARLTMDDGRIWAVLGSSAVGPAQWSPAKASGPLPNEVQTFQITGATGGDYTLASGAAVTDTIALGSSAGVVQDALDSILGVGNTAVTALSGADHFQVAYQGSLSGVAMPPLVVSIGGLTGAPVADVQTLVHGGVGGHLIVDDATSYPARPKLHLTGDGVTITDDPEGDATVVTITGGGGGGGGGTDGGFAGATYASNPETAIPDAGGGAVITASLVVAESAVMGTDTDFPELHLYLTHPFVSDLSVTLVGPDNALYDVVVEDGPNVGLGTAFDADHWALVSPYAAIVMNNTTPSYVGRVKPSDGNVDTPWAGMTGKNIAGNWRLRIQDMAGGDTGVLHNWGLTFSAGLIDNGDTVAVPADKQVEWRDGGRYGALRARIRAVNINEGTATAPEWQLQAFMWDAFSDTEHGPTVLATSKTGGPVVDVDTTPLVTGTGLPGVWPNPTNSVVLYANKDRAYLDFEGLGGADSDTQVLPVGGLPANLRPHSTHEIFVPYRGYFTDTAGHGVPGEFWEINTNGSITRSPNAGVAAPNMRAHISWRR